MRPHREREGERGETALSLSGCSAWCPPVTSQQMKVQAPYWGDTKPARGVVVRKTLEARVGEGAQVRRVQLSKQVRDEQGKGPADTSRCFQSVQSGTGKREPEPSHSSGHPDN